MQKLFWNSGGGSDRESPPPSSPLQSSDLVAAKRLMTKLRGYHELVKDAMKQADALATRGDTESAQRVYETAATAASEGLAVAVPTAGLEAAHSNAASWRADLVRWRQKAAMDPAERAAEERRRVEEKRATEARRVRERRASHRSASGPAGAGDPQNGRVPGVTRENGGQGGGRTGERPPHGRIGSLGVAPAPPRELNALESQILEDVVETPPAVRWDDVIGLDRAKRALQEMVVLPTVRADLFQGLRRPARGLLLYGPPGTGKTMLARAVAGEAGATFFAVTAASLTSKWVGEGEKLVRALFSVAARSAPSVVFVDEVDGLLSRRGAEGEQESSRRLKTEFLSCLDGIAGAPAGVTVLAATNRPWELDDAVLRRLPLRVLVPLPDTAARARTLGALLAQGDAKVSAAELARVAAATAGYSGSDLAALAREAAMAPVREVPPARLATLPREALRPVRATDLLTAMEVVRPSVSKESLTWYDAWTRDHGTSAG